MKPFISPTNLTKEAVEAFWKRHLTMPNFKILHQCQVDGDTWYTVSCRLAAAKWIRSQDRELWHEHINGQWEVIHNTFDIHEKLYTMLALKWA